MPKMAPKKKAGGYKTDPNLPMVTPVTDLDQSWEEVSSEMEQAEEIDETRAELAVMQTRMLHMENAIQMILQHVSEAKGSQQ